MILLQILILVSVIYCSVSSNDYKKVTLLRTSDGDEFTWDGDCGTLDATSIYYNSMDRCKCRLEGQDGTYHHGSFYRSSGGNYRCYYGMGQVANASFTLGNNSCSRRSSVIATFGKRDGKMIYLGDDLFSAYSLEIRSVQFFSYQTPPLKDYVNPFRLKKKTVNSSKEKGNYTAAIDSMQYDFQLRWKSNPSFALHVGLMLRIVFESNKERYDVRNHTLLLKIPGEREYYFASDEDSNSNWSSSTTQEPIEPTNWPTTEPIEATTTRSSTTGDPEAECSNDNLCSEYRNLYNYWKYQWENVRMEYMTAKNESSALAASNEKRKNTIIGLGVVCGVLLLIIIILIILLCCRNGCSKRAEEPSLVISSSSATTIPPRRDTGDKPPVAPARTYPARPLDKKGGTKKIPEQPLYESIHRKMDLYETPIDGGEGSSPYHFETLNKEVYQETGYIEPL